MIRSFLLSIGIAMLLVSCAPHKMNFDCKEGRGVGCQSVSRVNDLINQNALQEEIAKQNGTKKQICKSCTKNNPVEGVPFQPLNIQATHHGMAVKGSNDVPIVRPYEELGANQGIGRTTEEVLRIWFSGYFDAYNNYQSEQYVYTVVTPAKWVME